MAKNSTSHILNVLSAKASIKKNSSETNENEEYSNTAVNAVTNSSAMGEALVACLTRKGDFNLTPS